MTQTAQYALSSLLCVCPPWARSPYVEEPVVSKLCLELSDLLTWRVTSLNLVLCCCHSDHLIGVSWAAQARCQINLFQMCLALCAHGSPSADSQPLLNRLDVREYCLSTEHVQTVQPTTVCASAALGIAETVPGEPCIGDMQQHSIFRRNLNIHGFRYPWGCWNPSSTKAKLRDN